MSLACRSHRARAVVGVALTIVIAGCASGPAASTGGVAAPAPPSVATATSATSPRPTTTRPQVTSDAPSTTTTVTATTSTTTTTATTTIATTAAPVPPTTAAPTIPPPPPAQTQTGWIALENARPGTTDWQIPRLADDDDPYGANPTGWIEGYAGTTSARPGEKVQLFVDTPAASFTVRAFRMGWYGGARGRLVWESPPVPASPQPALVLDAETGAAEAPWNVSVEVDVTADWLPGAYLLRLDSDAGGSHHIPLLVRDDAAAGGLLFVSAVTTWQAYNPWGGCSLYSCYGNLPQRRAEVVSFDRPYSTYYNSGAADFPTHELPLIAFIEEQGLDVGYATSIDLHRDPSLAVGRRAILSPGHDEYYSDAMRQSLVDARAAGVNLAFFGANAIYRRIRFEPGRSGAPERRMVNYRGLDDPAAAADPMQATLNWRDEPLDAPEADIVGIEYACSDVRADMVLTNTGSWIYAGTGAIEGDLVPDIVGIEIDALPPRSRTAPTLEVLAASPVRCNGDIDQHVMAYHSLPSGSGLFATGTIDWGCGLDGTCDDIAASDLVRGVTGNVLRAFAAGPAGLTHPSVANVVFYRSP